MKRCYTHDDHFTYLLRMKEVNIRVHNKPIYSTQKSIEMNRMIQKTWKISDEVIRYRESDDDHDHKYESGVMTYHLECSYSNNDGIYLMINGFLSCQKLSWLKWFFSRVIMSGFGVMSRLVMFYLVLTRLFNRLMTPCHLIFLSWWPFPERSQN